MSAPSGARQYRFLFLQSKPLDLGLVFERELQDGIVAAEAQLLRDVHAMVLDCAVVDEERVGDLFARLSGRDQPKNPALVGVSEARPGWRAESASALVRCRIRNVVSAGVT